MFLIIYVVVVWFIAFHSDVLFSLLQFGSQPDLKFVASYSFWIAILFFVLHLWINERLSELEEVTNE